MVLTHLIRERLKAKALILAEFFFFSQTITMAGPLLCLEFHMFILKVES